MGSMLSAALALANALYSLLCVVASEGAGTRQEPIPAGLLLKVNFTVETQRENSLIWLFFTCNGQTTSWRLGRLEEMRRRELEVERGHTCVGWASSSARPWQGVQAVTSFSRDFAILTGAAVAAESPHTVLDGPRGTVYFKRRPRSFSASSAAASGRITF